MSVSRFAAGLLLVTATLALGTVLAAAAAQEIPPNLLAQELVEQLVSPSADERKEAREGLLTLAAAAVPSLISATKSDSALLRWEAVNLLGMIADPRGIDAVLHVAMTDSDVHARWRSNWAITRLDDGTVVPRLIAAIGDEDRTIAWNAAVTLSLFGVTEAVPVLHQGLDAPGWRQWRR
jgi:HEAT repeat protein